MGMIAGLVQAVTGSMGIGSSFVDSGAGNPCGTTGCCPSAVKDAMADAASGFKVGTVLIKCLGQVGAARRGRVVAVLIVCVLMAGSVWEKMSVFVCFTANLECVLL